MLYVLFVNYKNGSSKVVLNPVLLSCPRLKWQKTTNIIVWVSFISIWKLLLFKSFFYILYMDSSFLTNNNNNKQMS